eukprot:CFRG4047T1
MPPNLQDFGDIVTRSIDSLMIEDVVLDVFHHEAQIEFNTSSAIRQPRGTLFLVGSGPGDPDLLTVAAHRHLTTADLVVSDRLIPQEILQLVEGELKIAHKYPGNADAAQIELMNWCLEGVWKGLRVVRLKNGDPFLFGRGGEEVNYFRRFSINPAVVPGISSSLSAPLLAGIPLTHRGVADQLLIATAHGKNDTVPDLPPYAPNRTTVFLMSIGRLRSLTRRLISESGFPKDTPAAIIEKASCLGQRVFESTLEDIAEVAEKEGVKPPGVVVVGHTVNAITDYFKF